MSREYKVLVGPERYPVLRRFFECRAPVSVVIGALGSGKGWTVAQRILVPRGRAGARRRGCAPLEVARHPQQLQ